MRASENCSGTSCPIASASGSTTEVRADAIHEDVPRTSGPSPCAETTNGPAVPAAWSRSVLPSRSVTSSTDDTRPV